VRAVDSPRFKILDRGGAEKVVAHPGDQVYLSAEPAGCNRLVGSLASESQVEIAAEDRLTRTRKTVVEGGEIDIGTSHYDDSRLLRHERTLPAMS
jgi:hypothetical protein